MNDKLRIGKQKFKLQYSILNIQYLIFILLFSSCEKDITLDVPLPESKVVVDGYVEIDQPVYVILTRNAPYFSPITPNTLVNSVERGAKVTVSDGTNTEQLIELQGTFDSINVGGLYIAPTMKGNAGKTYALKVITTKGETLTASTYLSLPVPLDSVWFKIQENYDSLGFVWAHLTDPDTMGNCYRWFAKRLNKDDAFLAPFGSTFEDKFINGKSFDFAYNRGSIDNSSAIDDNNIEEGFFKVDDTIVVKFCSTDRSVFEFWRDAEGQVSGNGSPFASPSNIHSNIVGGLGLFAGYSSSYDTIIARR